MKLAEALVQRADLKRRLAEIQGRLTQTPAYRKVNNPTRTRTRSCAKCARRLMPSVR